MPNDPTASQRCRLSRHPGPKRGRIRLRTNVTANTIDRLARLLELSRFHVSHHGGDSPPPRGIMARHLLGQDQMQVIDLDREGQTADLAPGRLERDDPL